MWEGLGESIVPLLSCLLTESSNGDFAEATDSEENVFIKDGFLQIQPTLQDEKLINENSVIDLTKQGCTGTSWKDCHAVTNTTNSTIVPPTRSARLITKGGVSIQYGRVEVEAQLPDGDWLWPAIWMMPVEDTYGEWPNSGEIDIMESRGNNYSYKMGGNDISSSALHWGPTQALDAWYKTHNERQALHTTYTKRKSPSSPCLRTTADWIRDLDLWSGKAPATFLERILSANPYIVGMVREISLHIYRRSAQASAVYALQQAILAAGQLQTSTGRQRNHDRGPLVADRQLCNSIR